MKLLLIGGSQNGREIEIDEAPHRLEGARRDGNFETYLIERSQDGTFYAIAEELTKW